MRVEVKKKAWICKDTKKERAATIRTYISDKFPLRKQDYMNTYPGMRNQPDAIERATITVIVETAEEQP